MGFVDTSKQDLRLCTQLAIYMLSVELPARQNPTPFLIRVGLLFFNFSLRPSQTIATTRTSTYAFPNQPERMRAL